MTNVITEEQAKERVCCGPGLIAIGLLLVNHVNLAMQGHDAPEPTGNTTGKCIASECMAWRKVSADFDKNGNLPGYCGLAGAPGAPR